MMQIVTSSFYATLPAHYARLSIARWAPKTDRSVPTIRELAPGSWFRSVDEAEYRERYLAQLDARDPRVIIQKIEDLAGGRPAALLCWERPRDGQFCHRGYVSAWLGDKLGLDVPEFGLEDEGAGWRHPKLPAAFRIGGPAQRSLL